jgi:lipopolysaccharide biosynthesis regulator YciM
MATALCMYVPDRSFRPVRPQARVAQLARAVDLDPKSRDAQIALGMACWGLNAFKYNEETLRAFSAAQQLDPRGFTANLLLGYIESQYQRFDDAVAHLGAAIAADASAPEPWYQLGMNAYEQSRDKEASKLLSRYVSLAEAGKNGKPAQLRQGWNLLQKGDAHAAYRKFAGAHALARRSVEARATFGSAKRALHLPAH